MAGFGQFSEEHRARAEQSGRLRVVDELYGYSVRPGALARRRATLVEWSAYFVGFLLLFGIVGLFASASNATGAAIDTFMVAIAACGAALGGFFFWVGIRGTAVEVQVDLARRELRTAVRNWRGTERVLETHKFADVESMFVHRKNAEMGRLCLRTVAEPAGVEVLAADNATLKHLHEVMARDVALDRPQRKANASKRVKSVVPDWARAARAG